MRSCFICGNNEFMPIGPLGSRTLRKCNMCGLQFLDPAPDEEALREIYADYYKAWGIEYLEEEVSRMKRNTFTSYMNKIKKFMPGGKMLDIGCATGEFMSVAQASGFEVYGVEVAPPGIYRCRELFGAGRVIGGTLREGDFPQNYFDVITLSDVIEHIAEPHLFLDILANILKPEGVLMIVTPDTSSRLSRLMGHRWPHYKEEHVFYYNRSNISRFLSSMFDTISITPAYKTLTINYCLNIIKAYSYAGLLNKISQILACLPRSIREYQFNANIGEMFILFRKKINSPASKGQ